jgi:PIN domain nuclease of toxin-antitoxin system
VTDTHPLLWFAGATKGRLSRDVHRIFRRCEAGQDTVYVPAAVVWETAYLTHAGHVRIPLTFEGWWEAQFLRKSLVFLPLSLDHLFEARSALNLGDFFDELIVGAARARRLPLLTRDLGITESRLVQTCW